MVYAKNRQLWSEKRNLLPRNKTQLNRFKNPDDDPRGPWRQGDDGTAKSGTEKQRFEVVLPSGRVVKPPKGRYWAFSRQSLENARKEGRAYFGNDGDRLPIIKRYLSEVRDGVAPRTWWSAEEVGTNQGAKRDHLRKLLPEIEPFSTPKPEGVLQRVVHISTNPGDIVLDSFLGSGTSAAVAHKMNRRWIGVELGDHCNTHCLPRLKKVCDGIDQGGISESVDWKGGGGFKYYYLAPSLLKKDPHDNWIIDERYNPDMLAAAMAKHEGFKYSPHEEIYWKQGQSTEQDYIFTTTQFVTVEMLDRIESEMGPEESLLICCRKFSSVCKSKYENITIKKIPNMLLGRCEFGRDDYSLNIVNMPQDPDAPEYVPPGPPKETKVRENNSAQTNFLDSLQNKEGGAE